MNLTHVLLRFMLVSIGLTAGRQTMAPMAEETNPVLTRLDDSNDSIQRRVDECEDMVEACVEWEEDCLETQEVCDAGFGPKCKSWSNACTHTAQECTAGWEEVCISTSRQCTGGYEEVCEVEETVCSVWTPWPLSHICMASDVVCVTRGYQCKGWEEVCTATKSVCKGWEEVCKAFEPVCHAYEEVCLGLTRTVCTAFGQTCKSTGLVCDVTVGGVAAMINAIENFGECMEDAFSGKNGGLFDDSCLDSPANPLDCYVRSKGATVLDGFVAGCEIATMSFGVQFGSLNEDERDTAVATITIGRDELEVPLLSKQWEESRMKDFVYIFGQTSFDYVGDIALEVEGANFDLTLPGVQWDVDAGVTLFAEHAVDPCEEDIDECRIILNKGKTTVFQQSFAAGPVPVVVAVKAEVYLGAYPKFEGSASASLRVFFEGDGVNLLRAVDLPLHDPASALSDIQDMVNGEALLAEISDKIRVEVTGELEATAQVDLCVGVLLSFHVNGVGSEVDIPICLTALLEVAAEADLSGAQLNIEASLSLAELKLPFTLDLPDVSAVIDTACGFVQAPLDKMSPITDCSPILTCFTDLVDDTCEGLSDAVSALDIEAELGEVSVYDEQVIWSHTLTLLTGGEGEDSPARECTRYTGLNMSHKKAGKASLWTVTETLKKCEDLCLSEKDCAMYTFVDDTKKFGPKCLTWTLDEARLHGRTNPEEWNDQKGYTSAVCLRAHKVAHYVASCDQCGVSWCEGYTQTDRAFEEAYRLGLPLANWGCDKLKGNEKAIRVGKHIYAVEYTEASSCSLWDTDGGWYRGEYINHTVAPSGDSWTWQDCAELCALRDQCEFWTLQPNDGECLLMRNRGEYVSSWGHVMGPSDENCIRD